MGLYAFGVMSKRKVKDRWVPWICIIMPMLTYLINAYSQSLLNGYVFGFDIIILNGFLTFLALMTISRAVVNNKKPSIS
ncbi:MAG: hypothetical protein CMO34_04190 [Verrucomicrobia bacterium]|nr:hypothetical protein [Verrucomicrobiota bacterium]